jgi:hypothetical protein
MNRLTLIMAMSFVAGLVPDFATAQPNKERYELEERCGKRASAVFEKEMSSGLRQTDAGVMTSNFRNHRGRTAAPARQGQ